MSDSIEYEIKAGARNNKTDAATIQSIHDEAVGLGASCPNPEPAIVGDAGSSELAASNNDGNALYLSKGITMEEVTIPVNVKINFQIGDNDPNEDEQYQDLVDAKAVWSTAYKNDLPDSCFLYVEPGEKDSSGKTTPRSKRHFPYKDKNGKVDLPHLRNAIARIPQSNAPGLSSEKKASLQKRAQRMLNSMNGKDISLSEREDAVRQAVSDLFGSGMDSMDWGYCSYIYEDYCIIRYDKAFWRASYTMDDVGDVTIQDQSKWKQVQMNWKSDRSMKILNNTDGEYRLGQYAVIFNTEDLTGEKFLPTTDYWLDHIKSSRPALFDHGLDSVIGLDVVGKVDKLEPDEYGIWSEMVLDRSKDYFEHLAGLAEQGKLGLSTGTVGHLARREGKSIVSWPIVEVSLTPTPAEPGTIPVSVVKTLDGLPEQFRKKLLENNMPENEIENEVLENTQASETNESPDLDFMVQSAVVKALEASYPSLADALAAAFAKVQADSEDANESVDNEADTKSAPQVQRVGTDVLGAKFAVSKQIKERGEPQITSMRDAVRALTIGRYKSVVFTANDATMKSWKTMVEGTDSAGGFLVPPQHSTDIIDRLVAQSVVRRAGASVVPMSGDTMNMPKLTGGATANWIGEGETITGGDLTFGQVQLVTRKLVSLAVLSRELAMDSSPQAETIIRNDIARSIRLKEDYAY